MATYIGTDQTHQTKLRLASGAKMQLTKLLCNCALRVSMTVAAWGLDFKRRHAGQGLFGRSQPEPLVIRRLQRSAHGAADRHGHLGCFMHLMLLRGLVDDRHLRGCLDRLQLGWCVQRHGLRLARSLDRLLGGCLDSLDRPL